MSSDITHDDPVSGALRAYDTPPQPDALTTVGADGHKRSKEDL